MKNPIIFLDFDGVLNSPKTWGLHPLHRALEPALIARAAKIASESNAKIVISSTWRYYHSYMILAAWLRQNGWEDAEDRIISETPRMNERRAVECKKWLDINTFPHPPYVVLDDDSAGDGNFTEVEGHWVNVNPDTGLSDKDVEEALRILKG